MSLRIVKNNQCSLVGLTAHLLRGGGGWSLMSVYPVVRTLCLLLYLAGVIFCPPVTGGILVGKISNIFLAQLMCSAKLIVSAHTHSCQEPIDSEQNMIDHFSYPPLRIPASFHLEWHQAPRKNSLFLFDAPNTPLVLGFLWLNTHNPNIDLLKGRISGWSLWPKELAITQSSPAELPNLTSVPDLAEVFKDLALSLQPYSFYDCGIDFLPGDLLPTSHLYSLVMPARALMEKYFMNFFECLGTLMISSSLGLF